MAVLNRLFNRLYKAGKQKYDYEIEIDKGAYKIMLYYWVKKSFFLQAAYAVQKRVGKRFPIADKLEIPEKLYGAIGKTAEKTLKKIGEQVRQDLPSFKFVSRKIERGILEKKKDKYYLTVTITGLCVGD